MLTKEERLRALIGNLKNNTCDVFPKFPIEKEDAEVLIEYYREKEKSDGIRVQ